MNNEQTKQLTEALKPFSDAYEEQMHAHYDSTQDSSLPHVPAGDDETDSFEFRIGDLKAAHEAYKKLTSGVAV